MVICFDEPFYTFKPFKVENDEEADDMNYCIECRTMLCEKVSGYRVFLSHYRGLKGGYDFKDKAELDAFYETAKGACEFFLHEWIEQHPDAYKDDKEG